MRVLITGAAGFVGAHFVEHILRGTDWDIVALDRLDCSGNLNRLTGIVCWPVEGRRVKFVFHDLKAPINNILSQQIGDVDYCIHLAASSHVDRSIADPMSFVLDNVVGTTSLLMWAREHVSKCTVNFSTDEVFGPSKNGEAFREWDRYSPRNPYAAAKAGASCIGEAFANTYQMPMIITYGANIIGERQNPEKFVPLVIKRVLSGEKVQIHADPETMKPGSRSYIHARNVAAGVLWLLEHGDRLDGSGKRGRYNITGGNQIDNLQLAETIAAIIGKPLNHELIDWHRHRFGHDVKYQLDTSLVRSLGFAYPMQFEESLRRTVEWTVKHKDEWL